MNLPHGDRADIWKINAWGRLGLPAFTKGQHFYALKLGGFTTTSKTVPMWRFLFLFTDSTILIMLTMVNSEW